MLYIILCKNKPPTSKCMYFGSICDDDNDIEMALACGHAYLPSMTSDSMMLTVQTNSDHFTVACSDGVSGTDATDAALRAILEQFY